MKHLITNSKNISIIECEVIDTELLVKFDIIEYSNLLLSFMYPKSQKEFIDDLYNLNEIRSWWLNKGINENYLSIDNFVEEKFKEFVQKWDFLKVLYIIE